MTPDAPEGRGAYSSAFFDEHDEFARRSANVIVPLVCDLVAPRRVIDVGCGRGTWLRAFMDQGVADVTGLDGDYVDRRALDIPQEDFTPIRLDQPFVLTGQYDLAVCLEVAEHLPASMADPLVAQLASVAPVVLFSAALPGQGGTGHLNEQWPEYWQTRFARHGFRACDALKTTLLGDARVAPWYRQNLVLYASDAACDRLPGLKRSRRRDGAPAIEWVHISNAVFHPTFGALATALVTKLGRAVRRRWRHLTARHTDGGRG